MIQPSLGESERRNGRSEEDANQMQLTSPVTKMVLGAILSVTTEAIYIYIRNMVLYLANPYTVYPFVHVGRPNQIGVLVLVFNNPKVGKLGISI